jgi:uncharacterized protein (TIGR02453 family)
MKRVMTTNRFRGFPEDLFRFLEELAANNNREWFTANKRRYQTAVVAPVSEFVQVMGTRLNRISPHFTADPRPNGGSMFRIYRDTRFSRDKRPYKENVGCHFRHAAGQSAHAPGFYLHLQPGEVFAGAGIWLPPGPALEKIRSAIAEQPDRWSKVVGDKHLVRRFGEIDGDSLKRCPTGYAEDHPFVADLKRKSFFVRRPLDDAVSLVPKFIDEVADTYADAKPLMRFVAAALDLPF